MARKPDKKTNFTNARQDIDWSLIEREYSTGASVNGLAYKYKVNRTSIDKHIKKNEWKQDVGGIISKEVAAKVAGVTSGLSHEQKQVAIDAESTRQAEIALLHRKGIKSSREILDSQQSLIKNQTNTLLMKAQAKEQIDAKELEALIRTTKIHNEALVIAQEREARANGIDLIPKSENNNRIFTIIESQF